MVRDGDAARYAEANDVFHTAIYDGAHNGYLAEITRSTRQRLQPFRRAQFGELGRLLKSHAEHDLIVEAILRGERDAAEAAMRTPHLAGRRRSAAHGPTVALGRAGAGALLAQRLGVPKPPPALPPRVVQRTLPLVEAVKRGRRGLRPDAGSPQ